MLGCMVTLGTWNLENLFRPGEGSGPDSSTEYEKKLESLAETITNLGPDVLAVQEVGDPAALEDLAGKLQGTWRTALADPDGRGICVGFLSQSALSKVEEIADFPEGLSPVQINDKGETIEQMGRPALKVRVRKDAEMFDIVSVHLKSKLLSYPGGRFSPRGQHTRVNALATRSTHCIAEAAAVRSGVVDLLAGDGRENIVIVAGDLNDEPQAATTQILLGPGGSEVGTTGYERADKGDAMRMWNLAGLIPEDRQFTRIYRGRGELIDHIMVSHALTTKVDSVTTGREDISSVDDSPSRRDAAEASDHRPVVATFNVCKGK